MSPTKRTTLLAIACICLLGLEAVNCLRSRPAPPKIEVRIDPGAEPWTALAGEIESDRPLGDTYQLAAIDSGGNSLALQLRTKSDRIVGFSIPAGAGRSGPTQLQVRRGADVIATHALGTLADKRPKLTLRKVPGYTVVQDKKTLTITIEGAFGRWDRILITPLATDRGALRPPRMEMKTVADAASGVITLPYDHEVTALQCEIESSVYVPDLVRFGGIQIGRSGATIECVVPHEITARSERGREVVVPKQRTLGELGRRHAALQLRVVDGPPSDRQLPAQWLSPNPRELGLEDISLRIEWPNKPVRRGSGNPAVGGFVMTPDATVPLAEDVFVGIVRAVTINLSSALVKRKETLTLPVSQRP